MGGRSRKPKTSMPTGQWAKAEEKEAGGKVRTTKEIGPGENPKAEERKARREKARAKRKRMGQTQMEEQKQTSEG